jgi:hypothetical protein
MNDSVQPDEAAQALHEIGQRRGQIVDMATIPAWYWRTVAVLMVAFAAAADLRRPAITGVSAAIFAVTIAVLTLRVALVSQRRARLRNDLIGPRGVGAILGFVALTLLVSLPTAFILDAHHVAHAAVIGLGLGALIMAFGGPILMRHLRTVMLGNQAGGQR